jgi:hypothetical protein
VFLKFPKTFVAELLFVPVVLGEEFVEAAFAVTGRTLRAMPIVVLLLAAIKP